MKRGFGIRIKKKLFRKPKVVITDGQQTVEFKNGGSFVVETDKELSKPLLKDLIYGKEVEE